MQNAGLSGEIIKIWADLGSYTQLFRGLLHKPQEKDVTFGPFWAYIVMSIHEQLSPNISGA